MNELKEFKNERVKIFLNKKIGEKYIRYSGLVLDVGEDWIKIKDIKGKEVLITTDSIMSISKEEG